MSQKEVIEFVVKADDQTNQVVSASQVNTPIPNTPTPVDPNAGLQDALTNSLQKEAAEAELENVIKGSIFREAALKAIKEINDSIQALEQAGGNQPPGEPPTEIPTGFFDPEDNGEIPDYERLAQEQQDAIDDLIRSFDRVDNGPQVDQQRFDETTEEFDKVFADIDAVEDTMNSFGESAGLVTQALSFLGPEAAVAAEGIELVGKASIGAAAAVSSLVVATQLYSSVLAATIENFGELSSEVQQQKAQTEANRIQQQLRFADEFGDVFAEMEENRDRLRETLREFLANLFNNAQPFINNITSALESVLATLNTILTLLGPLLEIIKMQAGLLEMVFKTISSIAKSLNPMNWFNSDREASNISVWDELTAPENFLDVSNIRPKNTNGRDIYDMDDLMRKNL